MGKKTISQQNILMTTGRIIKLVPYLSRPVVIPGVDVISFPFLSNSFEILKVASILAIDIQTLAVPRYWPGQILSRSL